MINVKDVAYLLDLDEQPLKSIPIKYDLAIEHIFDESKIISFKVPFSEKVIVEQQIIYRGERYIITEIEEMKSERKTFVLAESAFVEMNSENVEILNVTNQPLQAIAERAASKSKWKIVHADVDDVYHNMLEENKSVLYILRTLARLADYYLKFDTIKREVYLLKTVGDDLDFIFRYQKNIQEIKKKTFAPKSTVLIPSGKGGMTIESVNEGKKYVEDYSWYESLGIPVAEARKRFAKTHIWNDERFIYAGNLMREAQIKLREFAHPQIAYETQVTYIDRDVEIGDFGHIVDDELDIKVRVRIVRLVEYEEAWRNKVEFNYLVPGLEDMQSDLQSDSTGKESNIILVKNEVTANITTSYQMLMNINITAFASTNAQVGLALVGQASTSGILLEGYFEIGSQRLTTELKQVLNNGWNTIGLPFIVSQIQDGSHELKLFLKTSNGTFNLEQQRAEMYIVAENLLGGMTSTAPRADIVEEIDFPPFDVKEKRMVGIQVPIEINVTENVVFNELIVSENISIDLE